MRILFVNDGVGDAGGVQNYLTAVAADLRARGHDLALLHVDRVRAPGDSPVGADMPHFCVAESDAQEAVERARAWSPDVAFSHNMRDLTVETGLLGHMPVVKMMHGYFGTCVGGLKMHGFPSRVACDRRFGVACAALYLPRHCGRWSVGALTTKYAWARAQHDLLPRYATLVVASEHMHREYVRNGAPEARVVTNPLFAADMPAQPAALPEEFRALFLGRMTALKGGDLLIRAAAHAEQHFGTPIAVTLAGDGPSRPRWEALAASMGVRAEFPGWVDDARRATLFASASVVVVPSVWPEPFGLSGLEGGAYGVASVGFDVGGVRTWLHDGENGWLVNPREGMSGLARALADARAHDATLRALRAGARRTAEQFSRSRHMDILERILADPESQGAA